MSANIGDAPRRGNTVVDLADPIESISAQPARAKRGAAGRRFGKRAVAAGVAASLAAAGLFAFAFTSRSSEQPQMESVNADVAIPAAAQEAAKLGFMDRSADASRQSMREGISDVAADENARERAAAMGVAADEAQKAEVADTAEERIRLMDKDLELVEKQAAQLKKEAEEAKRRLEEARKKAAEAAAAKAKGKGKQSDSGPAVEVTEQDIANLSSTGGSMPVKSNYRVGAYFGKRGVWARYHTGQDFPAPVGTPVYAVASGVVISPTSASWAGTNVVIQHDSGATLYAHLSRRAVSPGTTVKPGQLIGYVGNTGRSYGAHLHFEYYKNGTTPGSVYQASDPMAFLRSLGVG